MLAKIVIKDAKYVQTYNDCVTLFQNLDSFAKHLIKPMWNTKMTAIMSVMNEPDLPQEVFDELIWFLELIVNKALTHCNVNMWEIFGKWMLEHAKYKLPRFSNFVLYRI